MHLVRATPLKPGVTSTSDKFVPFTAATPIALDDDVHESGLCLRVKLRNPAPSHPFRTGQLIDGDVHIFGRPELSGAKPSLSPALDISRLSIRIYYESRTTFWQLCPTHADREGKTPIIQRIEKVLRHEVHRGVVPPPLSTSSWPMDKPFTIPFTETLLGRPHAALPFSFTLPRKMNVTETNNYNGLCSFERCPPPSFCSESDASVEWVVEAIMTLAGASGESPRIDERMTCVSTNGVVVSRLVFPVLPARLDVGSLRDEPFFGEDLAAGLLGARLQSDQPNFAPGVKLPNLTETTWERYTKVLNVSYGYSVESELSVPAGAMIPRDATVFTMRLALKLLNTPSRAHLLGLFRKNKPIIPRRTRFSLHRSIYARGGEIKPRTASVLVRQYDMDLGLDSPRTPNSAELRDGALTNEGPDLALPNITLPFDLQTDGMDSKDTTRPVVPLMALTPSFRTPNMQLEYVLSVSLFFVGDTQEYPVARFPLQITPESAIPIDGSCDFPDSKLSLQ